MRLLFILCLCGMGAFGGTIQPNRPFVSIDVPVSSSATAGIQEALNSIPTKVGWGTNTTGAIIRLGAGDFYVTNSLFYSNTYITSIRIEGAGILATRVIYAGQVRTNLLRICGGGNPNGGLSLPLHVELENLTFTSITNDILQLVVLTNTSYIRVRDCNFTGWEITTNQTHGPQLSIDGPVPTQPPGNVGLVVGNALDHGTFIEDCFFANLACGIDDFSDHMYVYGFKTALIGVYGSSTDGTAWPNTSAYFLGPAILIRGGLGAYIQNAHFYICYGGVVNEGSQLTALRDVQWEGADRALAVFNPSAATIYFSIDEGAISDDSIKYQVTHSPYAYSTTTALLSTYNVTSKMLAGIGLNGNGNGATNFARFAATTNLCSQPAAGFTPNFNIQNETANTNNGGAIVFAAATLPAAYGGDMIYHEVLIHKSVAGDQPVIFPAPYVTNINLTSLGGTYRCTNNSLIQIRMWPGVLTNVWCLPIN